MQNQTTGGSQQIRLRRVRPTPADRCRAEQRQQRGRCSPAPRRPPTSSATSAARPSSTARRSTTLWPPGPPTCSPSSFDQAELSSTATGTRPAPRAGAGDATASSPPTPTITGLSPSTVNTQGTTVVALFLIDQARPVRGRGLGRHADDDRQLRPQPDRGGRPQWRRQRRRQRQRACSPRPWAAPPGAPVTAWPPTSTATARSTQQDAVHPGRRLRLPRDHRRRAQRAAHAPGLRPRRQFRHPADRRRHDDRQRP